MILGSILCWTAWGIVLVNIDPFQDTGVGFAFFYTSLFFALLGTISVFAFFVRQLFSREALPMFRYVKRSFSDSFFISVALVVLLFLQGKGYLNLWNTGIFLLALAFILAFSFTQHQKES